MSDLPRMLVYDRFGAYVKDLAPADVFACTRHAEINGEDSLSITTSDRLAKGWRVLYRDHQLLWHEFIVDGGDEAHDTGRSAIGTYHAENSWGELRTAPYIIDKRPGLQKPVSAEAALGDALDGTRWEVGEVDVPGTNGTSWYHISPWEAVTDLVGKWGGQLRADIEVGPDGVTSRKLSLLTSMGTGPGVRFDYGADVTGVTVTYDESDIYTALYCYGKGVESGDGYGRKIGIESVNDGLPYVEDAAAKQIWGQVGPDGQLDNAYGIFEDGDIEDPAQLKAAGQAALADACRPKVQYKADVVVYERAGTSLRGVGLGERADVVDRVFYAARGVDGADLRLTGQVVTLDEDLMDEGSTGVTLGDIMGTIADALASLQGSVGSLTASAPTWNGVASGSAAYLDQLIANLNQQINATGGYTYIKPGQGIWVYDRAEDQNPTKVINLMGGSMRIADSKTASGDWDWRTVFVSGHVAADLVTAAQLTAGYIGSPDGGNFWNLDTGEFRLAPGTTVGGQPIATADDTISSVDVEYASGTSSTTAPTSGWSTDAPQWQSGRYIWQRTKTTAGDGTVTYSSPTCIQGAMGQQGVPGRDGTDGTSSYVHIKYAPVANPSNSQMTETPSEYIGICVNDELADPTTASSYTWSKWRGQDGPQGIQGPPGANGQSTYVHFAYSTKADGSGNFSTTPFDGARYIGVCTNYTSPDPTSYTAYQWSLMQGDGVSALQEQYYLSTSQTAQTGGSWGTAQPKWSKGRYIWTRTRITWTDGTVTYTDPVLAKAINGANQAVADLDDSLDQQGVFNRLTNNGKTQGIFLDDGLLYINASYLKAGTITGGGSHWDLESGNLSIVGLFQTSDSGNRVLIDPSFSQTTAGGSERFSGAGIQFPLSGNAAVSPYIASEASSTENGDISMVVINGGQRSEGDPSAFMRLGMGRKSSGEYGEFYAMSSKEYGAGTSVDRAELWLSSSSTSNFASLHAMGGTLGKVGIIADAESGTLSLGGALRQMSESGTFSLLYYDKALTINAFQYVKFTITPPSPSRSGRYKPFVTLDSAGTATYIIATVYNAMASGWWILVQSFPAIMSGPSTTYRMFPDEAYSYLLNTLGVLVP